MEAPEFSSVVPARAPRSRVPEAMSIGPVSLMSRQSGVLVIFAADHCREGRRAVGGDGAGVVEEPGRFRGWPPGEPEVAQHPAMAALCPNVIEASLSKVAPASTVSWSEAPTVVVPLLTSVPACKSNWSTLSVAPLAIVTVPEVSRLPLPVRVPVTLRLPEPSKSRRGRAVPTMSMPPPA